MRRSPLVAAVSIAAVIALAGCGSSRSTGTSSPSTASPAVTAPSSIAPATSVPVASVLTSAEQADLALVHEQERAGADAYALFASRYPDKPVFSNLTSSQKVQLATVTAMMTRYGLADPSSGLPAGRYADPAVQQLYDSTVAAGTTVDHALDAIVHFEEQHMASLKAAASRTTRSDLDTMYTNLGLASTAHITACHVAGVSS